MYGKRGGRVQVNVMQFMELVERVERLESLLKEKEVEPVKVKVEVEPESKPEPELTKNDIMKSLDIQGVKYNPRDRKDILLELLNDNEVVLCLKDKQEPA